MSRNGFRTKYSQPRLIGPPFQSLRLSSSLSPGPSSLAGNDGYLSIYLSIYFPQIYDRIRSALQYLIVHFGLNYIQTTGLFCSCAVIYSTY